MNEERRLMCTILSKRRFICWLTFVKLLCCGVVFIGIGHAAPINGTLRVSPQNSRYFTDSSGRAIYLTGSHTWNNLIDMDATYPPRLFNFNAYLNFLESYNHNFIRLWAWEVTKPQSTSYERRQYASPQPWLRTGPGLDITGLPKFDLLKLNQNYFDRLHERVSAAEQRGIYVSVMLFEGWAVQFEPGRASHPFNQSNNINGIHYGDSPQNVHTLQNSEITAIQESYVRKVIDTVNEFDNILYEIINESGPYSTSWQYHMIEYVKKYEATKSKQHPVGMTFQYSGGRNSTLFNSPADWISPGPESGGYDTNPQASDGRKIIIWDNDHIGGSDSGDRQLIWKCFTRGLHTIFMDRYVLPDSVTDNPYSEAEEIRQAMGQTRSYADRMSLIFMTPRTDIASTGYALASNSEFLVYDPAGGAFTVNLSGSPQSLQVEWFNVSTGIKTVAGTIPGGGTRTFTPPSNGEVVLYLKGDCCSNNDTTPPSPPTRLSVQ